MKKYLLFLDRLVYREEPAPEGHDKANRLIRDLVDAIIRDVGHNDPHLGGDLYRNAVIANRYRSDDATPRKPFENPRRPVLDRTCADNTVCVPGIRNEVLLADPA